MFPCIQDAVFPDCYRHRHAYPRQGVLLALCLILLQLLLPSAARAAEMAGMSQDTAPDVLMQRTARTMFRTIEQEHAALQRDPRKVEALVERVLVPHVDFNRASHWVLGRYWRQATPAQRSRFISEFRTLLVRFYSNALVSFLGAHTVDPHMLRFLPYRHKPRAEDAVVRSVVRQPNGMQVQVNYILHHGRAGWQVYDVTVEGISLVTTYRSSFAEIIRQDGLDGLIQTLARRNQKLLAAGQ